MEKSGSGIELALKTYDNYKAGNYEEIAQDATYTVVSSYAFGKLGKQVDKMEEARKITKADKSIVNAVTDA